MSQFYVEPPGGSPAIPTTFNGNSGTAIPLTNILNVVGLGVIGSGLSAAGNIITTGSGSTLTIQETQAQFLTNYTNANASLVSNAYTAVATDYYITGDTSAGGSNHAMTIKLPNAPTTYRMFVVKDRGGNSSVNNITITTVGGSVLIDGATTYLIDLNYESASLVFNGTSYEVL